MTSDDVNTLQAMIRHVEGLDDDLRPSRFWLEFGRHNIDLLMRHGIDNFKRTVNQNYYNWVPFSESDNQYRQVRAYYDAHPDPAVLSAEVEDWDLLNVGFLKENPFQDPMKRSCYARFVGLLWHHVRCSQPDGFLDDLEEPLLGNPIRVRLAGKIISQDLANSAKEYNAIFEGYSSTRRTVVGELGAGYGRLGHMLLAKRAVRYIVIDMPPALFVSQWYLSRLFPGHKVFRFRPFEDFDDVADELAAADIAFLAPDQFYMLPDGYFDIFATISSLAEMTASQISQYLGLMCCKTRERVYIKQWREWENPLDGTQLVESDYDLMPGWRKRLSRIDSVQNLFFETVWEAE